MEFNQTTLTMVLAFIAALPGILAFLVQLKKSKAENTSLITDAATDVIKTLREEINRLKEKNKEQEEEIKNLKKDIEELRKLVNGG